MATLEARGYVNKLELKTSAGGTSYAKFDLAVQQKRKDKDKKEIVEKLYLRCTDFDPKNLPAEGDYVGVTGYVTIFPWAANGKSGINIEVSVKNYETLEQKSRSAVGTAAAGKLAPPPEDPFALSPGKP